MNQSLGRFAPKWVSEKITRKKCKCGHSFIKSDITQIGIRKARNNKENSEVLTLELLCSKCDNSINLVFCQPLDFRQLLCDLLKEIQKIDHMERAKQISKGVSPHLSKISEEEMCDFKRKLSRMKNHTDFLRELDIEDLDED